jgi:hypothetical protein
MKFLELVSNIDSINVLKNLSRAWVVDARHLKTKQELIDAITKQSKNYYDYENVEKTVSELRIHSDRNVRTLFSLFLKEILLEKNDFKALSKDVNNEILRIEQKIINDSNDFKLDKKDDRYTELSLFQFILAEAWKHNDDISIDEKNLILKIQKRTGITDFEYMTIEAVMNKFPKDQRALHSIDDISSVRKELLRNGLILSTKDNDGQEIDIIPEEIAYQLRKIWNLELRKSSYEELLSSKHIKSKEYLLDVIEKSELTFNNTRPTANDIKSFLIDNIKPSNVIGGFSTRDGLNSSVLQKWLKDLGLPTSGTKDERVAKLVEYYDNIHTLASDVVDERSIYFDFFEELASRNIELLRIKGIITKDIEIERLFEKATHYAFERYLKHTPQPLMGTKRPDGIIPFKDQIIMWDNKSKESPVHLKDHINQFEEYIKTSQNRVSSFLVIGPSFTEESVDLAKQYQIRNDVFMPLITAQQFKELCLRWDKDSGGEPLPLTYFKQTGRFSSKITKY